ncbi:carbon storage regulator [mine drainage metagenome]|uniref:Carbon storage regulator n=1 Tax=mine drainage metagenome TaxID=410659 RepID=A0A1J5PSS4_9ZZZZ
MLILTRRPGEAIRIGENIRLVILQSAPGKVRLGIEGPQDLRVLREELYQQVTAANQKALAPDEVSLAQWLAVTPSQEPV